MYKLLKGGIDNKEYGVVKTNQDGTTTSFLFDEANTDYQEYLKWIAEGNLPSPADIVEPSPTASVEPQPADGE